ncbi:MAG: ABC transporter permease [Acidimicrobiales bacterium]
MRSVLTVAGVELRRFLRDRSNIFFVFIFPLLLVALIGAQFGEGAAAGRVAVSGPDSELRQQLVDELSGDDVRVVSPDWDGALQQLARGRIDVAVRVDESAAAAHAAGNDVRLDVVRGSSTATQVVEQQVRTAVEAIRAEQGQVLALGGVGVDRPSAEAALRQARAEVTRVELEVTSVDEISQQFDGLGQFDFGASGQLLLFVFLSSLAGSATLIQARRLRVVSRMLAAPLSPAQLVAGVMGGRWALAFFQGAYIMVASALLFGVNWGTTWLSLLVLLLFSLVSAGAAMLLGTVMQNEGAAGGLGVGLGLVLAALGGAMVPLEFFPDTMRTIARITPHAWGYEAFAEIQRRDGTLADIAPQLGVLAAMAALLLAAGAWSLRRSLGRPM